MENLLKDRRVQLAGGAALALLTGGLFALSLHKPAPKVAPPAATGGLVVESGRDDDAKLDPARPLRCFVGGQFAGELTLAACAQRNGVATGALDVGRDETGALAAADVAGTVLTPLPPTESAPTTTSEASTAPQAAPIAAARPVMSACWRYDVAQWRKIANSISLNTCVQSLFNGHCEKPGKATYARWGEQTLRLVSGRVEISSDNRSFQTLVLQPPSCILPSVG